MTTAILDKPELLRVPQAKDDAAFAESSFVSVAEYFRREEVALEKSEYRNGRILPMPGAKFAHTLVASNIGTELNIALKKRRDCVVLSSDIKIRSEAGNSFRYPDIAVVRGTPQFFSGRNDTIINPVAVVEVLSDSTEASDRGDKFNEYQTLPPLAEYVLVAQDQARIEVFSRGDDSGTWTYRSYAGLGETAHLPTLDISLALADVYDKVEFPAKNDAPVESPATE